MRCIASFRVMLKLMLCAMACSGAALSSSRVEQLNELNEEISQRVELDSPFGSGECSRCGRDGANDYNCCHAGGAWAGICGDEAAIARGAANYTWGQGFVVCQERLKRFKSFDPFHRRWRNKKRNRFEPRAPRVPGSLRATPSTPSTASVCMIRVHSTCTGFPGASGARSYRGSYT